MITGSKEILINKSALTNMTPGKRHNISHITRMELNDSEGNRYERFELPDLSRRSERKRIKIPQNTGKKKLPGCFSIPDDDDSPSKRTNLKSELNSTLDVSMRKRIQSEQVSPRNMNKPSHKNSVSIATKGDINSVGIQQSKFINISKQDWNDASRFVPIINSIL